ncbi:hypothetical protein LUZ60_009940 [Juncus effusus]|nr:hypothetical protein LUZ60_009940 [Juncus effusus]
MGGGHRPPEELAGDSSDVSFASSDDLSSGDESGIVELELAPISSIPSKPCEACFSAYARARTLLDAKDFILRYKPGDLIEEMNGSKAEDYEIPDTTTIVLIGPEGSGKTTLIKRISKLFDSDLFPSDPDQESYNSSEIGGFTVFLKEYKIPKRVSSSICIYDTPGLLTYEKEDNFKMVEHWMNKGVQNRDLRCDYAMINNNKEKKSQLKRKVNYAIFVVDAISVMEYMENNDDKQYIDLISETFKYPVLSFKGKKPAVVITHGEKLSSLELNSVHDFIRELLCISSTQIFDISAGLDDYDTELNILRLMHYCIDKADKCLQLKPKSVTQGGILQRSVRMIEKLVIYDKIMDAIIVFLCIIVLLIRFWGYIW